MRTLIERIEHQSLLVERVVVEKVDAQMIERLRKEFLLLMKNAKVVADYDQADRWRRAMGRWLDLFDASMQGAKRWVEGLPYRTQGPMVAKEQAAQWSKELGEAYWPLYTEARVPLSLPDDYWSKEALFSRLQSDLKKWEGRAKRTAQKVWKDVVAWSDRVSSRLKEAPTSRKPVEERAEIEGFKVILYGYDEAEDTVDFIGILRAGLRHYKDRANKVWPQLLKAQLPIFYDRTCKLTLGGSYRQNDIRLCASAFTQQPKEIAHTLAHEMGHHVWRTVLRGDAKKDWTDVIYGRRQYLDLREVVKAYPGKHFGKIEKVDPILSLQLDGLSYNSELGGMDISSTHDIKDYLDKGGKPVVSVASEPISAYAEKNPEEGFCEALGILVAYGPQAVLPPVRQLLRMVLPGAKIHESVEGLLQSLGEMARG